MKAGLSEVLTITLIDDEITSFRKILENTALSESGEDEQQYKKMTDLKAELLIYAKQRNE